MNSQDFMAWHYAHKEHNDFCKSAHGGHAAFASFQHKYMYP